MLAILFRIYSQNQLNLHTNLLSLSIFITLLPLLFLAHKDYMTYEVDHYVSLTLLIILAILNILLFLLKGDSFCINLTEHWGYQPYQNLLAAITLGGIFQLLVLLTREKGMGQGDVRIAIISGLIVGFNNILLWSYITIFTALIYGILLSYKEKRFKGLKIPFVPFMVLGIIVVLLLSL